MKTNLTLLLLAMLAFNQVHAQIVQSTFTSGDEGWTNEGDHVYTPPQYFAAGGNPGGYIRNRDKNIGIVWYWVAPAKFLGNHTSKYNRTIRFDLFQTTTTEQFDANDIILEGNGLRLVYQAGYNPSLSWTNYTVALNELSGWVRDTATFPAPTKAQMQSVLSNITKLMIRGEFSSATDEDGLDNVIFGGAQQNYAGPGNMGMFDGTNDYINLGNSALLKPASRLTVQCWAFIKGIQDDYRLVSNTQSGGYSIFYNRADSMIYFSARINGAYRDVTGKLPSLNAWHHYAMTYDGRFLRGYIDGVLQQEYDAGGSFSISYNGSNSTIVGAEAGSGSSPDGSSGYLPGYMDELSFWNTELSQKQIRDWMCRKTGADHPAAAGLVAYYQFNQPLSDLKLLDQKKAVYGTMVNGSALVTSSAPVGDTSSNIYGSNLLSLKHPDGDSLRVQITRGTPLGFHIYRVDQAPSITRGAKGIGPNNRYFGVFYLGDTTTAYRAIYAYKGNPFVTTSAEQSLKLYRRANNADTIWRNANATLNPVSKTLTANGQNTEYIVGSSDTALQARSLVTIGDVSVTEGNSGSKFARFIVSLNTPMLGTAFVDFITQDSTATTANNDYQALSGTAVFEPGTITDTVRVRVFGDAAIEPNEFFRVLLTNPVNLQNADSIGRAAIVNDDGTGIAALSSEAQMADRDQAKLKLVIPNLISRNQVWRINGLSGTENKITISNAAGHIMFKAENYQNDQMLSKLQPGIYFYHITAGAANNGQQSYKGKILITE